MKNIIFLIVLSFALFSCEDWLVENPKSTKLLGGTTAVDAQMSVNGIYAYIGSPYQKITYAGCPYSILEFATDQYWANGVDDAYGKEVYNLTYTRTNNFFSYWWNQYYAGIESANIAVSGIPAITDTELTDDLRSQLLGEAHFLRAYYYFMLVRMFGDIPMKTEPTKSEADAQIGKSSIKDIYETVIVPDLLFAEEQNMPGISTSGRVSKGAAKSLLAKVYLEMAGYPLLQTDKYALARDKAKEVIDSNWFSLFQSDVSSTWFDKFNNSNYDNKAEHIFMAQFELELVPNSISIWLAPGGETGVLTPAGIQFAAMLPVMKFYDSYAKNDLRAQNRGFFFNEYDGITFELAVYKYFDPTLRVVAPNGDKNVPLLRYADVLLTYAEAQNRADGSPNTLAYSSINSIRIRAGLSALSGLLQSGFEEAVWRERAWELTAEGQVWFDMKRTRKVFDGSGFQNIVGYTLQNGKIIKEENLYFLIPQFEYDTNPNLQN